MKRTLSLILVVAAACGGSSRPPPTAPLPEDPPAQAAPMEAKAEAEPAAPAAPAAPSAPPEGPIEVKIPAPQTTVKIVSAGTGKKAAMRYSARAGTRQAVEVAMDFTGRQDSQEQTVPTIVLTGEAETREVDKDGNAAYTLTVTGTDARQVAGSQVPVDQFKAVLGALAGLTIGGTLATNGTSGETTLRIERAPQHAAEALDLIRLTFPALPMLPREPVGVGAKWRATTVAKLSDRLDVTQVTDYEVVSHVGATWKIKGTTKVSGKDQNLDGGAKVSAISGNGTSETTIADGALYPTHKSSLETQFKASDKDASTEIVIKVGGTVTPR